MNQELATIFSLRRVLERTGEGMGMAQALVRELRRSDRAGAEVARKVLLGWPLATSLRPLTKGSSEEVSMLAALMVSAPGSSSALVGRSGSVFAGTVERWVRLRENSKLEMKVQRFRSLVASAVLGAVTAMVASLGPLVANLNFFEGNPLPGSGPLLLAAAGMTAVSSGMLGFFMSGRRFYLNAGISLGVFVIVSSLASPLTSVTPVTLWGVK